MFQGGALKRLTKALDQGNAAFRDQDLRTAQNAFTTAVSIAAKKERDNEAFAAIALAARIGLGRIGLAEKEPIAAAKWFAEVQRLRPDDWRGHYWYGCAAAHGKSFEIAERYLTGALVRGAPEMQTLVERAQVRVKLGQCAAALADLRDASGKGTLPDRIWQLGAALALREHQLELAEWFAAASAAPLAAAVSGTVALRRGDPEAAMEAYERALEGGLQLPEVYLQHGAAAYRLGRFDRCRDSWSSAGAEPLALEGARYAHAMQRLGEGDFDAALVDFEATAEHGYDAPLSDLRLHAAAAAIVAGALHNAARHLEGAHNDGFRGLVEYVRNRPAPAEQSWQRSPEDPLARLCLALTGEARHRPARSAPRVP